MNNLFDTFLSKVSQAANHPGRATALVDALLARITPQDTAAALPIGCWLHSVCSNCYWMLIDGNSFYGQSRSSQVCCAAGTSYSCGETFPSGIFYCGQCQA